MKVSKNSRLDYKISFYIPVNDALNKIKISTEKNYIPGVESHIRLKGIFVDSELQPMSDIDYSYPDSVDDLNIESTIDDISFIRADDGSIVILGENVVKVDKARRIDLDLRIWVRDLELLLKAVDEGVINPEKPDQIIPLEIISKITGLDSSYNVLFEEVVKKEAEFERYNILGAAPGGVVKKRGYEETSLIVSTVAIDAINVVRDAAYVFTIQVNDEIDISEANDKNIFVTMDGVTLALDDYKEKILKKGQELTIYIWHKENLKSKPFYISIPAMTKPTITNIEEDFIRSKCSLTFINIESGEVDYDPDDILSIAPIFSIRTNLEYVKPELSSATKIII